MEQEDKEKEQAVKLRYNKDGPDDDLVCSVDTQAQEHDANAGFDSHIGNHKERLAQPPELYVVNQGL